MVDASRGNAQISLREAYEQAYLTVKRNVGDIGDRDDLYGQAARKLVEIMPKPSDATPLEMRALLGQVRHGMLEWAYQLPTPSNISGLPRTLGEFCRAMLELHGDDLTSEEQQQLASRLIFPYTDYAAHEVREKALWASARTDEDQEHTKPAHARQLQTDMGRAVLEEKGDVSRVPDAGQGEPSERTVAADDSAVDDLGRISRLDESGSTPKLISDMWVSNDTLGYGPFARSIATLIAHDETKPPLTIAVKAPWGAGKTSIMRMVQAMIDPTHPSLTQAKPPTAPIDDAPRVNEVLGGQAPFLPRIEQPVHEGPVTPRLSVWFDAWRYQTDKQLWAGLAHCIITQVSERMPPAERERFWAHLNAQRDGTAALEKKVRSNIWSRFGPKLTGYAAAVLTIAGGTLFVDSLATAAAWVPGVGATLSAAVVAVGTAHFKREEKHAKNEPLRSVAPELVREPDYSQGASFLHDVDADVRYVLTLVATPERPLVVFIDDLDRCTPNHIAQVVEAIHLFLAGDYSNCVFVLGLEPGIVAAAIEVHYRDTIAMASKLALRPDTTSTGWRFMEKIVQLPVVVPRPTEQAMERFVHQLLDIEPDPDGKEVDEDEVQDALARFAGAYTVAEVDATSAALIDGVGEASKPALVEASLRAYSKRLTERDPVIRDFCLAAARRFGANPRQIKRYLNQFRLLSLIRFSIRVDARRRGEPEPELPPDAVLTKYVVLSTEWPQAVDCIGRQFLVGKEDTELMSYLESQARQLASYRAGDADAAWEKVLDGTGFNFSTWGQSRRFREHLADPHRIGEYVGNGLW